MVVIGALPALAVARRAPRPAHGSILDAYPARYRLPVQWLLDSMVYIAFSSEQILIVFELVSMRLDLIHGINAQNAGSGRQLAIQIFKNPYQLEFGTGS